MSVNETDIAQGLESWDSVLDEIRLRKEEFAQQRYVPRDMIRRFKALGLYRASAPAKFGGEPLPPAEFLEKIETISAVDGSCGWVASFGSSLTYLAALPVETQAQIYQNGPDVAFAAGIWVSVLRPRPSREISWSTAGGSSPAGRVPPTSSVWASPATPTPTANLAR